MNRFYCKTWENAVFFIVLSFVVPFSIPSVYGATSAENYYQAVKKDYIRLKESNRNQKYRDHWERVIYGFVKVANNFPNSSRADDGLYNAGMISLKLREISRSSKDSDAALRFFKRLAQEYPKSRYADDAQYMIGEIYRTIKDSPEKAYTAYAAVSERFPEGDMVAKAKKRLSELPLPSPEWIVRPQKTGEISRPRRISKEKVHILGVRHWVGSDYVRIVIDLDGPIAYEQHQLSSPDRVYVDLKNARLSPELKKDPIPVSKGYLKAIRLGQFLPDTARVVLDFQKIRTVSIFPLSGPDRIVMDIAGEESTTERFSRIRKKVSGEGEKTLTLSEQLGMKVAKVVIDPGHGGKDPGCVGKSGLMEKEITLDVGRRLKKLLEEDLNLEVVMTRDRDVFVPLDERTAIANREKADLFISIHVNAAANTSLRGIETWFLDLAASERAKKIAARENLYVQRPMSDLDVILNDLLLNSKTQESSRLAEIMQGELATDLSQKFKGIKNHGVKGAPFVVLVGARMPSVLTEIAFISNPTEEKRLKTGQYRSDIAQGLMNGVRSYMSSSQYASMN